MAAEGIGVDGLHCISGTCDLCGESCDANTQELNVLSCTFKNCEDLPYHQDCLEKYLKSIRLERNRKTGFKCPRGCGKGTKHPGPCPGKIDKSHPIHPRNEEQKKKKKAALPQVMAAAPVRVIKTKEEKKAEKEKAKAAAATAAAAAEKQKASKPAALPRPAAVAPSAAAPTSKAKQQQQPDARKLAETAAALKREIAATKNKQLEQAQQQQRDASPSQPEYKTLDAYLRENSSSASSSSAALATQPVANAWAKPPAPAAHALSGVQHQQRHRPAEPSRLQAATTARDLSPVSPAAAAAVAAPPPAARASTAAAGRPVPAAAAGVVPVPQPPPPPPTPSPAAAAAAAGQQPHPGLHHVPSIHSHPLATQGSTASLASQSSAGASGAQLPVGAEYVGEEGGLTKAQRKNLKRAEKKKAKEGPLSGVGLAAAPAAPGAAAGAGSGTPGVKLSRLSVVTGGVGGGAAATPAGSMLSRRASSTSDSLMAAAAAGPSSSAGGGSGGAAIEPQDEESVAVMHELAVHALLAKKTLALVASLQRLGFTEWQAAAAVQRHGSELEDAVAWLLDGGAPDPDAAAAVSTGCVADVSIVEELRLMEALGAALPQLPRSQLYVAVADAGGDLDKAAAAAMAQHTEIVAAAAEAAEAEAAAAAAAAAVAAAAAAAATPMGSSSSPLASVSVTASPTSTTSMQQQQHVQAEQLHEKQQVQALQQKQQEQQQQQLPNGLGTVPEAAPYSAFGDGGSLSLYAASAGGLANALVSEAAADAGLSPLHSPAGFGSFFAGGSSSTGLGSGLSAHPLHSLASTSSLGVGPLDSAGSGVFGGYGTVPGSAMSATAAAAMASNIWGSGADAASSSAGWGQLAAASPAQQLQQPGELLSAGAGSGSLFTQSGLDTGLGGWGASGLGLLGNQGSMATAAPAANPYAPFGGGGGGLFGPGALGVAPLQQPAVSTPAAGDAGLQQSRLFSSYGVSQPPLYGSSGGSGQAQQQQAGWGLAGGSGGAAGAETAASADTDDDLEGMLATLMCH